MGTGKNPSYNSTLGQQFWFWMMPFYKITVFSEVMILLIHLKFNTGFNSFVCLSCCQNWTNNCNVQGFPSVALDPCVTVDTERSQRLKILALYDLSFSSTAWLHGTRFWQLTASSTRCSLAAEIKQFTHVHHYARRLLHSYQYQHWHLWEHIYFHLLIAYWQEDGEKQSFYLRWRKIN